jgi:2-polyprenyl-3-methyl-5-hydroxy-6-metoxy-1,4-benzoquinol methylase
MPCPYCNENRSTPTFFPLTDFNGKTFRYIKCTNCEVVFIDPLPDSDDYFKMYPTDYQNGVDKSILTDRYKKLPGLRYSYGIQFDLIKKHFNETPKVLDFGCGNANFLVNANAEGIKCDGAEYNELHVEILKKEIPTSNFYTTSEILHSSIIKYDIIRLSNVLEHLDKPNETLRILLTRLNKNGILLIEGPIECNFNFAFFTRKIYFKLMNLIKNGYVSNYTPTHITFTNSKNQLAFFEKFNLTTLEYQIREAEWPYPESYKTEKGIGGKIKVFIAKTSIKLSSKTKNWGNTFIYFGRNR